MLLAIALILLSIADAHWLWYPIVIFWAFCVGSEREKDKKAAMDLLRRIAAK